MGGLGIWELALIFLVVLLVFGAKRIPEIARGLGSGIREFKDATSEITREITSDDKKAKVNSPRQGAPQARQEPRQEVGAPAASEAPQEPARADNPSTPREAEKQGS